VPTGKHEGVIPKGTPTTYAVIERVKILGYRTHQYLIWSQGAQHVRIANNIIEGGQETLSEKQFGQDGIEIYGGDDVVVEGNTVNGVEGTGIWTFSDETAYSTRLGIRVIGNYVTQSRSCIGGANSSEAKHIHYKNNVVRKCWTTGISFNASDGVRLQDIQITGNSVSDVTAQGISMHGGISSAETDEAIVISGNVITNAGQSGIVISNHSNVKIAGNSISRADTGIFISSSSPGAVNISLENNTISKTNKEGINVYYAKQLEVLGNVVKDYNLDQNNHAGIYFHAGEYLMAARNILKYGGRKETMAILSYADNVDLHDNTLQYSATLPAPFSSLGKNAR
jgi:nitrous oxidase accessory protein NosD